MESTAAKLAAIELLCDVVGLEQGDRPRPGNGYAEDLELRSMAIARRLHQLAENIRLDDELDEIPGNAVPDMGTAMLMALVEAVRRLLNITLRAVGLKEVPPLFGPEVDLNQDALPLDKAQTCMSEDHETAARNLDELLDQLFSEEVDHGTASDQVNVLQEQLVSRLAAFRERFSEVSPGRTDVVRPSRARP
ncbi:hypothetical protein [Cupriavidus pinatubonensis]|uniref:hypothetical protein n=1 Tax=Cupriavidus pinatubonensis TaxID=248026 RepID=UPI00361650AB